MKHAIKMLLSTVGLEVRRSSPLDRFSLQFNQGNATTFLYLSRMIGLITSLDGAVVECGVGKARTLQMLALLLQEENKGRALWGFDSFEGFPEPSMEDTSPRNPKKGEWKKMTRSQVYDVLNGLRITTPVHVTQGYFEDALRDVKVPPIALLHLDVDLYKSYKTCLEYLFPLVVQGGVVLFDEYRNEAELRKFPGASRAIDEYVDATGYPIRQDPASRKYFLIKTA
jgi:hypothetical protein